MNKPKPQPKRRTPACPSHDTTSANASAHDHDAIALANSSDSPLLLLPAEIRNRIYALVLGVGHIHVRYRPWRHCARSRDDAAAGAVEKDAASRAKTGYYALALPADADPWGPKLKAVLAKPTAKTTSKTTSKAAKAAKLTSTAACGFGALLQVCRQIHAEAALLPFSLNAWSFESARVMERYLVRDRRLALAQRRAIRVLVVADDLPSRSMERYLGGLRVVVWRDASTKTFERWELPRPVQARGARGKELLLYD